jgi:ATP-dependent Clp protease ATP-binding subunit ClpA
VLLLDEIEKAHPDIFDILLQVMDHATLTDSQGREADFRHVTLIMTSNVGAREIAAKAIGFGSEGRSDGKREVERLFSPEFRNRLDEIIRFEALGHEVMGRVVDKFITEMESQLSERKVRVELTPAARERLAKKGYDPVFGARPLARLIQTEIQDALADELLFGKLAKGGRVRVDAGDDGFLFEFPGSDG